MPRFLQISECADPAAQPVEIVERKGLGHPDTICDALAEEVSCALSVHYRDRFGFVLHHNVDKVLPWGGASRPAFGGGEVLAPIEIFPAGRATRAFKGIAVPVDKIAIEAARAWLRRHLQALDTDQHVKLHRLNRRAPPISWTSLRASRRRECGWRTTCRSGSAMRRRRLWRASSSPLSAR